MSTILNQLSPNLWPSTVMTPFAASSSSATLRLYEGSRRFLRVLPGPAAFSDARSNSDPRRASRAEHQSSVASGLEYHQCKRISVHPHRQRPAEQRPLLLQ